MGILRKLFCLKKKKVKRSAGRTQAQVEEIVVIQERRRVCCEDDLCSCCEKFVVLFFPDKEFPCTYFLNRFRSKEEPHLRVCYKSNCNYSHRSYMIRIFEILNRAKKSLRICVFLITYTDLVDFIIFLKTRRGISVKLITDSTAEHNKPKRKTTDQNGGFEECKRMSDNGIKVKTNAKQTMHNKYIIVDDSILLSGSFNYTRSAIRYNDEFVIVNKQPAIIKRFSDNFEKLWTKFPERDFVIQSTSK